MSTTTDAHAYRRRKQAHDRLWLCMTGWVLAQRARLGQAPRSRSVGGRESVYLPTEMR